MKMTPAPRSATSRTATKSFCDLVAVQRRRRLVEDEHVAAGAPSRRARGRSRRSSARPRSARSTGLADVERRAEVGDQLARRRGAPSRRRHRQQRPAAVLRSRSRFSMVESPADQAEVLVDEVQPGLGSPSAAVPSVISAAGIGLVQSGQDLDQRRLARAVLADEGDDLPRADLERDVVERPQTREGHREVADVEEVGHVGDPWPERERSGHRIVIPPISSRRPTASRTASRSPDSRSSPCSGRT